MSGQHTLNKPHGGFNMAYDPRSTAFDGYTPPERVRATSGRRVYVALLSPDAGPSPDPSLPPIYVGQTGKSRADRFREHKIGYKYSRYVRSFGIRLMPELYPDTETIDTLAEAENWNGHGPRPSPPEGTS